MLDSRGSFPLTSTSHSLRIRVVDKAGSLPAGVHQLGRDVVLGQAYLLLTDLIPNPGYADLDLLVDLV